MNTDDVERLRHLLEAAREALGFVQGKVAEDLTRDRLLLLALVKEIELFQSEMILPDPVGLSPRDHALTVR